MLTTLNSKTANLFLKQEIRNTCLLSTITICFVLRESLWQSLISDILRLKIVLIYSNGLLTRHEEIYLDDA